jgi:hypothetical protein
MARIKKTKIKLDNLESLEHLMQETYNNACSQQNDAQRAINKMENGADPADVDDYTKIAKEKSNLLKIKDSAIKIKLELSKIKADFIKKSDQPINDTVEKKTTTEDFKKIREMLKENKNNDKDEIEL